MISPGELHRGCTHDPVRVNISTTRHHGYRGLICRSGADYLGNLLASYLIRKDKIPFTHYRSFNYDAVQEIRIGTPESSDTREQEVSNFFKSKRGADLGFGGGRAFYKAYRLLSLREERRDGLKTGMTPMTPNSRF